MKPLYVLVFLLSLTVIESEKIPLNHTVKIAHPTKEIVDESGAILNEYTGEIKAEMPNGAPHIITYSIQTPGEDVIVNLEGGLFDYMECLKDGKVALDVRFADWIEPVLEWANAPNAFLTGRKDLNCWMTDSQQVMLREVVSAEYGGDYWVVLKTTETSYENLIKTGKVSVLHDCGDKLDENGEVSAAWSKCMCIGFNVNDKCESAGTSIPIYHDENVDVVCKNCFIGAKATIFYDVEFGFFKIKGASAGLKGMELNAGIVIEADAHGAYEHTWTHTWDIVPHYTLATWMIGPIPFYLWLSIPLDLRLHLDTHAQAMLTLGALGKWALGDAYVKYDGDWTVVKPSPHFTWNPVLDYSAQFTADTSLTLAPTIDLHLDGVISVAIDLEPTIFANMEGAAKPPHICTQLDYEVASTITSQLNLFFWKKTFGPYTLFDTGEKEIGKWCKDFAEKDTPALE